MYKVYLLHYDRPIAHAQHYLGFTHSTGRRMREHRDPDAHTINGRVKARLPAEFARRGISFVVARVWKFATAGEARAAERRLKRQHNARRQLCPVCKEAA